MKLAEQLARLTAVREEAIVELRSKMQQRDQLEEDIRELRAALGMKGRTPRAKSQSEPSPPPPAAEPPGAAAPSARCPRCAKAHWVKAYGLVDGRYRYRCEKSGAEFVNSAQPRPGAAA